MSADALAVASAVCDPELPVLTLADLGVLRSVEVRGRHATVTITPTYSGCPALATMRDDLVEALAAEGFEASVRVVLTPAWSTDWISDDGRRKLASAGIAPPSRVGPRAAGPVPLNLVPPSRVVACPLCGSARTSLISEFGATACKSLRRCTDCREPFEHVKEF